MVAHSMYCLWGAICIGALTGLLLNVHSVVNTVELDVRINKTDFKIALSGFKLTSSQLFMTYNYCLGDEKNINSTRLYGADGIGLGELLEGGTRDQSIMEFSHLNIHEDGIEILGDISLVESRAKLAQAASMFSVMVYCLIWGSVLILQLSPLSTEDPTRTWTPLGKLLPGCMILASIFLWYSMVIVGSNTTVLLSHVFREGRERCQIDIQRDVVNPVSEDLHLELRMLGRYIRANSFPVGASHCIYSAVLLLVAVYLMFIFLLENGKVGRQYWHSFLAWIGVDPSDAPENPPIPLPYNPITLKLRTLSWYNTIWYWPVVLVFFIGSVYTVMVVGNATRLRGYELNMFHWRKSAAVARSARHIGLSSTGTLLDFGQSLFEPISIPETYIFITVYAWPTLIPIIGLCSHNFRYFLTKVVQDFSVLLLIKATISYVTLAPTSVSILERPECFEKPPPNLVSGGALDIHNSCNDTMFSIHAVTVFVSASIVMFYMRYAVGIAHSPVWHRIFTYAILLFSVFFSLAIVILTRNQYTADVHIGACITLLYMLTQSLAYKVLLQDRNHKSKLTLHQYVQEKLIPTIQDCTNRMESYNTAAIELPAMRASREEIDELLGIYKSVAVAIDRIKTIEAAAAAAAAASIPRNHPAGGSENKKEQ